MFDSFKKKKDRCNTAICLNKKKIFVNAPMIMTPDCMWSIYIFYYACIISHLLLFFLSVFAFHLRAATALPDYQCMNDWRVHSDNLAPSFFPPRGTGCFLLWKEMGRFLPSTKPCRLSTSTLASSYPATRFLGWM